MPVIHCYSHFAGDPYFNMAFDDWTARQVVETEGAVIIRLYTWKAPAITFGYHQSVDRAFDLSRLRETPAIRRITGGRALLHDPSELTYAIGMNLTGHSFEQKFDTVSAASEFISKVLVEFVTSLGWESQYVRQSSAENSRPDIFQTAPCFSSRARYEVVSGGKKLVASAQRRFSHGLFQHGSIKIGGIASHPALSGAFDAEAREPVTGERFMQSSTKFFETMSESLGMSTQVVSSDRIANAWVAIQQQRISRDSFKRREVVKQKELETSL